MRPNNPYVNYMPGYNPCLDMSYMGTESEAGAALPEQPLPTMPNPGMPYPMPSMPNTMPEMPTMPGSMPGMPSTMPTMPGTMPGMPSTMPGTLPATAGCPAGAVPYTVEEGDTLYSIARLYGATVADILAANPGLGEMIYIGQVLCIPIPKPCRGQKYTVQPGDTFYNISRKFGITVSELMAANPNITPNMLMAGGVICVPTPVMRPCPAGAMTYTVVQGDTLTTIAERFSVSIYALTIANPGVAVDSLMAGMRLCIAPFACLPPCIESERYVIAEGEDLMKVAEKFTVTTDELLRANPFVPPCYFVAGNPVCIPQKTAPVSQRYRRLMT
jgi:peptidoglycan DL-endopeptidase LytF